jgi:hypothetical protein
VKVGFTGTRMGMTEAQMKQLRIELHIAGAKVLHHGDCRGADEQAHGIARELGLFIIGHPPIAAGLRANCACDETRDVQDYLVRNRTIVLETELLIAAPHAPETRRSGTWATIRHAKRMRLPLIILHPDGPIEAITPPPEIATPLF